MAADYWASSHHKKWVVDRLTLYNSRLEDLRFTNAETLAFLNIFFANLISKLGKKLHFRQRVIATATLFFRRFYLKNSLCDTEPYIVLVACCYLAGKAEELPAHIKNVIQFANGIFLDLGVWTSPLDNHRLAEMEFYLVDELECDLTVYHPYRSLTALVGKETDEHSHPIDVVNAMVVDYGGGHGGPPEMGELEEFKAAPGARYGGTGIGKLLLDDKTLQLAWLIINDTYRTDVCLLYPPFLIAVAAIYLSLVNHERVSPKVLDRQSPITSAANPIPSQSTPANVPSTTSQPPTTSGASNTSTISSVAVNPDPITFLANLNVSLSAVAEIAQEMLSFYSLSSRYSDDSGPGISSATATAALGAEAFFMDLDTSKNITDPSKEKVRAKHLVDVLKRMRAAKQAESDGTTLALNTSNLPASSHSIVSPVSAGTGGSGMRGAGGRVVNKRLERAQAAG